MPLGKVKEYDVNRGCGIIIEIPGEEEFVVYANYVYMKRGDSLKAGQNVEFEKQRQRSAVWAVNVKVVGPQG